MVLLGKALKRRGHDVSLWCLRGTGPFLVDALEFGIPVRDIKKGGRYDFFGAARRLRRICCEDKPDVIISCLPSANLFALWARWFGAGILRKKPALVWGLASAKLPVGEYGWWARVSYWAQAKSAHLVDKVVVNSVAGFESATEEGYPGGKLLVIHNGVDMQRFRYSPEQAQNWREQMGIGDDAKLVGMAGRLDPAKNYEVFLRACEIVAEKDASVVFVIVGGGDNGYANALRETIQAHSLYAQRLFHRDNETEMPSMYSALDVMTLTSKSEGLPNTVVEALACGKRCVVTDVGDCRLAVDRFGIVCEVGDHKGIAEAWLALLDGANNAEDRVAIRAHTEQKFGLEKMADHFVDVCESVIEQRNGSK